MQKIKYRLVYNYAGRLNKQGYAPVALECRQSTKKMYISSKILLKPDQWDRGKVINHSNAEKLTVYLTKWRNQIEEIELDALLKGRNLSLYQLKTAIKSNVRSSASISDFVESIIYESARKKSTIGGYKYLVNDLKQRYGDITLEDISYDMIDKYRNTMRKQGLSENTIKGRLKLLHCIATEALKRNLINDDPFKFITIGDMTARVGYLTMKEVKAIERLKLAGKEAKVRDLFLLACFTGLRWGDLSTLEEAVIENGILHKMMLKTNHEVHIPIDTLFWGKAREIIARYPNIKRLSHCCCDTTANKILKDIAKKAGINKRVYMHLGRKTFSCMLQSLGVSRDDISILMGHKSSKVTQTHYLFNNLEQVQTNIGNIFQNKSKKKQERT